jgi:hypothetical protein
LVLWFAELRKLILRAAHNGWYRQSGRRTAPSIGRQP